MINFHKAEKSKIKGQQAGKFTCFGYQLRWNVYLANEVSPQVAQAMYLRVFKKYNDILKTQ